MDSRIMTQEELDKLRKEWPGAGILINSANHDKIWDACREIPNLIRHIAAITEQRDALREQIKGLYKSMSKI